VDGGERGRREREAHGAEDSLPASVTPRDLQRRGRAAAVELEPWPAELRPPPPDRGRSAAAFSRLDAEESAAAILRREAPPRGPRRGPAPLLGNYCMIWTRHSIGLLLIIRCVYQPSMFSWLYIALYRWFISFLV
jgi:hypothetical protein